VSCANGAPDACRDSPKKATAFNESCHSVIGCKWIAGPWGVCSNDCGDGEQSREVRCGSGKEEAHLYHQCTSVASGRSSTEPVTDHFCPAPVASLRSLTLSALIPATSLALSIAASRRLPKSHPLH
jgi:hypothetical protein